MATIETRKYIDRKTGKIVTRYRARVRLKGFPVYEATFDRRTDAVEWAKKKEYELKHQQQFGTKFTEKKTVSDVAERYLTSLKLTNPKRYDDVKPMMDWWVVRIGTMRLSDLTKDQIIQNRDYLKSCHVRNDINRPLVSNSWVNRVMGTLKRALNLAVDEWEWMPHNPMTGIKSLKEPGGRTRHLQGDEFQRLLEACKAAKSPLIYKIVVVALATGGRRSEIKMIRLTDIDLANRKILLPKTKSGKPRFLRIQGHALQQVTALYKNARPGQVYLFPSPNNIAKPYSFDTSWDNAVARAGIEDFNFHDLRHTAASLLAQNGAGLHHIAEVLGHTTLEVTKRYTHLLESDTAVLVEKTTNKAFANEARLEE